MTRPLECQVTQDDLDSVAAANELHQLRSAVPSGGSAPAAPTSVSDTAGASFPIGSHVKLSRSDGSYYYGRVTQRQINGNHCVECRVEWDDDGAVTWLPAYRLEPHGVETELGWEEKK